MNMGTLPASAKRQVFKAYVRKHFAPYRLNLLLIVMKNIIGSFLHMLPPFMSKYVLESVLPQRNMTLLIIVSICMVAAPITGSMMIVLENMWGRFMLRLSAEGRAELYNGLQHRPLEWLRETKIGDLTTRMLDDTRFITDTVNGQIGFMLFHVVTIVAGSIILLVLQPALACVVLALWLGQALLMSRLGGQVKKKAADTARHNSIVAETVRELVSGAAFIKAEGLEAKALGQVKECLSKEWEHTRYGVLADHRVRLIHAALNAISLVLMYTAGGWFVLGGSMTVGSLVAFVAVYNWLRPFGISLIERALSAIKLLPSIDRIAEISFPAEVNAHKGLVPEGPITVEATGISSRHDNRIVLDNIDLRLPPGSVVSLVGHRGSGKSTLADLLLGLRKPASGSISLNGIPLTEIDSAWLRRHMLCVTQDVMLRSGTILDNIVYGSENAGPEAVREAVRIAELEHWISRLRDGLHTRVGEQALQISGGERQRISIARALLRNPAILILDEATSSLDQGTERRLLDRLVRERKGTTFLFITHRLEAARRSDQILVLDEGRIADSGTHADLLTRPGIYRELWEEQSSQTPSLKKAAIID
ncbi:ABC transporter ATP-binding protein [Paenibacillus alkalitolerans]|uniref:ABC transporter ATP-binding protein n=1 Tax=Paenibacillus alkalitolerans TaxID=2799335 RepID=UPI0018F6D3CE|nr:ABC transporter ATP-binding protein [Paenibacillus alkalitolerans]